MGKATTFQHERAASILDELTPVLAESWRTVQPSYPNSKLKPDVKLYLELDASGVLRIITMRVDDILVGFALLLIVTHPHRMDDTVATIDTLFIMPAYRNDSAAVLFIRFMEHWLRERNTYSLTASARDSNFARWLRMAGYPQVETVHEKVL